MTMTVKELRELLKKFPPNADVVYARYSDVTYMDPDDVISVTAVERVSPSDSYLGWLTVLEGRGAETCSAEDRARSKTCVLFPGN